MNLLDQQIAVTRQRKLADLLRAKVEQQPGYQERPGQMVSGHYVAPSWSQNLTGLVDPMLQRRRAGREEALATQQEGDYNAATGAAREKWQSALPQAVAGMAEREGPVDPSNPTELNAIPAQPVTSAQILKHTLAGMEIPGNERAAALYNQGALADQAREDNQAFRKQESDANRAAALQKGIDDRVARMEELKVKMEDRALDRASREQMAKQSDQLRREIAQGNQALQALAIEVRREAIADRAAARKETAAKVGNTTEGEKSSAGFLNRMNEAEKVMSEVKGGDMGLLEKGVGGIPMIGKTVQPYVLNKQQQQLYQAQRDWVRAKLRKESGAVIGDEEMAEEIRTYFPQPGEGKDVIEQKANARKAAIRQMEIGAGREAVNANSGPTTKTINGKTYININGQWYEQ